MASSENWTVISGWASLIGLPSSVVSFVVTNPYYVSIPIYGLTSVALFHWAYVKYKTRKTGSEILSKTTEAGDFLRKDFELIENHILIDILDSNGSTAKVELSQRVRCKVPVAQAYYFRISPIKAFSDFTIKPNGSTITHSEEKNGLDIDIKLNRPYKLNDILDIKLSFTATDLLCDKDNWWIHRRFFKGTNEFKITVRFPMNRPPTKYSAKYYFNSDIRTGKLINDGLELSINDGRPELILQTKEAPVDFNIILDWSW